MDSSQKHSIEFFTGDKNYNAKLGDVTSDDIQAVDSTAVDAEQARNLLKSSLDFLAATATPHVYAFPYPPVYVNIWRWLLSLVYKYRKFPKLALGLPRGFAKTSFMKLFILYVVLFTKKKFVLVFGETSEKAENIVADVIAYLSSENLVRLFGNWRLGKEIDRTDMKKFSFRGRTVILKAAGINTSVRGIVIDDSRPDVMLFDDIQSRDCADSEVQSMQLLRWMVGTAMKAKAPTGCMFLFVANMYPTRWSLLKMLKDNPTWLSFVVGGILEDGTSLWEELQPIDQLISEWQDDKAAGQEDVFFAEVLNDETASANKYIDLHNLPELPFLEGDVPEGKFIVVDPSGWNAGSISGDDVGIGYFEVFDTKPVLQEVISKKLSPGDTIREAAKLALKHGVRIVAIESIAAQSHLLYWWDVIVKGEWGVEGIEAIPISPKGRNKNSRILSMLKSYANGDIYVGTAAKPFVHNQIAQFNALKRDNVDDVLDLLAYGPIVLRDYSDAVYNWDLEDAVADDSGSYLPFISRF